MFPAVAPLSKVYTDELNPLSYSQRMRMRLTAKAVESLKTKEGIRYDVRDETLPGLLIRVSNSGQKVWYVHKRVDGRMRRVRIGAYPLLSLSEARQAARKMLVDMETGAFVAARTQMPRVKTLAEITEDFIALYAKPRNRDWKRVAATLQKFEALFTRPIDAITRADVVGELDKIVAAGAPIRANRAAAAIKTLMNWSVDRGLITASPLVGLRMPTKEEARERVLSATELRSLWIASTACGYPFGDCIKLLILTGQRRSEVAGMRWSELDLPNALWNLPGKRVKNASAHIVPLSDQAVEMLRAMPRFLHSDYVFTTTGRSAVSGFGRAKARIDHVAGLGDWRIHDLRRTVATNMAMMRIAPHVIEAVLNHRTGIVSGVAAIYNRHGYLDEKREALHSWGVSLTALLEEGGEAPARKAPIIKA